MLAELDVFSSELSSMVFVWTSAVALLVCAEIAVWMIRSPPARLAANRLRRAF